MSHVRPKKHFGQHFLKEDPIARRIVEALTRHGGYRHVIEVGPGTGALTKHLLEQPGLALTCVELDAEAAAHLRHTWPMLRLVEGDLLKLDLSSLTDGEPFALVGNFPYNISTEIVFHVLAHRDHCTEVVGMFQKEVADRLAAPPGSRTYGVTSVLTQAWYTVDRLFHVEPGSFIPPPKVRSSVIRMLRNSTDKLPCDEDTFRRVVKAAFNQRRKTLHNALKGFPGLDAVPAPYARLRAEALSVQDFIVIAQAVRPGPVA
ncbi:MAG: ribosomal RNA small subunit methyltransferase A [Flavobacteriales bacterium]|nr:ribosomal RNA small subunit methyltransferase A [Flavobacteriales bacterium]